MTQLILPPGMKPPQSKDRRCPQCRAPEDKRVPSSGFGRIIVVCDNCGYEFPEEK